MDFPPWSRPALPTGTGTINPGMPPSDTGYGTMQTEYGVGGHFDSPEDTAQTSPSVFVTTVSFEKRDGAQAFVEKLKAHENKFIRITKNAALNGASVTAATIKQETPVLHLRGRPVPNSAVYIPFTPLIDNGPLCTLFPRSLPGYIPRNYYGVLVSHVHEKSRKMVHCTLAVEHATNVVPTAEGPAFEAGRKMYAVFDSVTTGWFI